MITPDEAEQFADERFLVREKLISDDFLERLRSAFDVAWETCEEKVAGGYEIPEHHLLRFTPFLQLIEYEPILSRHEAVIGHHIQLACINGSAQYARDRRRFVRDWHRDFDFVGQAPVLIQTIVFLDEITPDKGPTRVIPRSQRPDFTLSDDQLEVPHQDEVALPVSPGTVIFLDGATWHTAGKNLADTPRRGLFLQYSHWWLKRYRYPGLEHSLPWEALEGASQKRLSLLGIRNPSRDMWAGGAL